MVTGTIQNGRSRIKDATQQIIDEEACVSATIDALRDLLYDLCLEGQCADMTESYDVAVDAAEVGREVTVARAIVGEVAHSGTDGAALTRVAVDHAPDPTSLEPEPPAYALEEVES